jgi:hypothetical protein
MLNKPETHSTEVEFRNSPMNLPASKSQLPQIGGGGFLSGKWTNNKPSYSIPGVVSALVEDLESSAKEWFNKTKAGQAARRLAERKKQ